MNQEDLPFHSDNTGTERAGVPTTEPDPVVTCGINLMKAAGRIDSTVDNEQMIAQYTAASHYMDVEFLQYMLAVIYVESRFNRKAVSYADARGLMQMTAIAVEDAVRTCSLKPLSDMNRLHDSVTNIRYGTCYLKKLYDEMDGDWTRTLITYNGGYKALQSYDKGETINQQTANYVLKVTRVLNTICRNGDK